MGLTATHDCWSASYSGFNDFRQVVGLAARLPYVTEPGDRRPHLDIDWDQVTERQLMGHWDRKPPTAYRIGYDPPIVDPVLYLLIHSDCEGKLRRGYLPALKARLEELEPRYREIVTAADTEFSTAYLEDCRRFINGLGNAIEAGEHVEFH